jgi:LSD1 subclass zinc finger protein
MDGAGEPRPLPVESGDPVCWLHLVCESCGALLELEGGAHRPDCDRGR